MIYSSAIYMQDGDDLEQAQKRKMARITELLDVSDHDRVLEIGCGWGALSRYVAECKKVHIHGITLSTQQLYHAQDLCAASEDRALISLSLTDYRDVRETYDRIVSIEMIEAVGEEFLPGYFETIRDRLKPGGLAVIQAITIDEKRFDRYKSSPDFIKNTSSRAGF